MAGEREEQAALSVSAAMGLAKGALEGVVVRIVGEVSEVSANARYKAVYFTVKDAKASLPCMMWNNRYAAAGVELAVGALVELSGRFTLYAAKGRMNFDVFSIALAGEGMLRMQVANLAAKLKAEGLFDAARKKRVPAIPERIGLVTSPRGAAVHDVLRTLRRRLPLSEVLFAGVTVEGQAAPAEMMGALRMVQDAGADVILLVRGGGSFEDLMPFNDEALARTIASMEVPVVTGIGHEPDTSIADMAADLRASTPTAAADAVSASAESLAAGLDGLRRRMAHAMEARMRRARGALDVLRARPGLSEPLRIVEPYARALDDVSRDLAGALPGALAESRSALERLRTALSGSLRRAAVAPRHELAAARSAFGRVGMHLLDPQKEGMALCAARLHDLSPLGVVARGYAIARGADGSVVASVDRVAIGDAMQVVLADGVVGCTVVSKDEIEMSLEEWEA